MAAESLEDAVKQVIRNNEGDWEYLFENAHSAPGYGHVDIYVDDEDPVNVGEYLEENGWSDLDIEAARTSCPPLYRGYLSSSPHTSIKNFALERVRMNAPQMGDAALPAIDYTWSVSEDMGKTQRNPTDEEKSLLADELRKLCHDCGDAEGTDENPVGFDCGHIAHPSCHTPNQTLSCAYATTSDPDIRIALNGESD